VQFQYLGNSLFQLTMFKGGYTPRSLTTFIYRISYQNTRSIFSVKLTKYQSKGHYQKNRNYRWQKSVGNDKSPWVIKNYPRITDDSKSVCNSGIGKF